MLLFLLVTIALKLDSSYADDRTNLIFLQIMFRHGDRGPVERYPNDPNSVSDWPEGLGKLTKLGKKQHYVLGKHIRSMYPNFITSNPNEVKATSSEVDRCLRSALSHLAGLYEPTSEWVFDESIKWQPIPVEEDQVLSFHYPCPRADERTFEVSRETEDKYKNVVKELAKKSGANITGVIGAFMLFDTLFAEKKHNLIIPEWADKYWRDLEEINDLAFNISSPTVQRLRAGPLLKRFMDTMAGKIGGSMPEKKVQLYSTHDIVVATVLSALGLYNGKRPPYASTLILELREDQKKHKLIRFLYLNSTNPEAGEQPSHVLKLEGCSEYCPLDYFKIITKDLIPGDLAAECKV